MSRKLIKLPNYINPGRDEDSVVLNIRNAFRESLDPDGLQTKWQVSDIVKWEGTSSSNMGWAFTVQCRDSGASTGHEWLITFLYSSSNSTQVLGGNNAAVATYYRSETNGETFSDKTSYWHYNDSADTTPYQLGLNPDGSHPSGDFSVPAKSPYTQLDEFMPGGKVPGLQLSTVMGESSTRTSWTCVADDQKPFLSFYYTNGHENYVKLIWLSGNIVVPYRSTDTFTSGSFWWNLSVSSASEGYLPQNSTNYVNHYVHTHAGDAVNQTPYFHSFFNEENTPFSDGTYPWDVLLIASDTYHKGYIDSDIVRVMGPANEMYMSLYDGGNFIKYHESLVFPYVPNKVVFPPGE